MTYPIRQNVRYEAQDDDSEGIWYLRCDGCASSGETTAYWPIGLEHWNPGLGLQCCRACHRLRRRRTDHATAEFQRARERGYYRKHRKRRRDYANAYYRDHADEINERRRQRRREQNAKRPTAGIEEPSQAA